MIWHRIKIQVKKPCLQEDRPDVDGGGAVLDHVVHGLQVVQLDRLGDPLHGLKNKGQLTYDARKSTVPH